MALFGKKDKKESSNTSKAESVEAKAPSKIQNVNKGQSYEIILHPRLTEKATGVAEDGNVYTFDIDPRATKMQVSKAVKALYNVNPLKVRTVTVPKKNSSVRGRNAGLKGGGKKAYVYLKKGETIEFV